MHIIKFHLKITIWSRAVVEGGFYHTYIYHAYNLESKANLESHIIRGVNVACHYVINL